MQQNSPVFDVQLRSDDKVRQDLFSLESSPALLTWHITFVSQCGHATVHENNHRNAGMVKTMTIRMEHFTSLLFKSRSKDKRAELLCVTSGLDYLQAKMTSHSRHSHYLLWSTEEEHKGE